MHIIKIIAFIILLVALISPYIQPGIAEPAENPDKTRILWPMYMYTPQHNGTFPGHSVIRATRFKVAWKFEAKLCIASQPAIAKINGKTLIYFSSCDGHLYVVNSRGELVWSYNTGGGMDTPALGDINGDGQIDVVVGSGPGDLWILDAATGKLEYRIHGDFSITSPALYPIYSRHDDIVIGSWDGNLYIITIKDNKPIIRKIRIGNCIIYSPSIVKIHDKPYILIGTALSEQEIGETRGYIALIDPYTGKIVSHNEIGDQIHGGIPVVDYRGEKLAVATTLHQVVIFLLPSLKIISQIDVPGYISMSPAIGDFNGDHIPDVAVTSSQGLYVYSINGTQIYSFPYTKGYATPIYADVDGDGIPEIIVPGYDGRLVIINYKKGPEYFLETKGPLMRPPSIADIDGDGMLEILQASRDFYLYCIKPMPSQTTASATISRTIGRGGLNQTSPMITHHTTTTATTALQHVSGTSSNTKEPALPHLQLVTLITLTTGLSIIMVIVALIARYYGVR